VISLWRRCTLLIVRDKRNRRTLQEVGWDAGTSVGRCGRRFVSPSAPNPRKSLPRNAIDSEWRFVYFNGVAVSLTGCSRSNVISANFFEVFPEMRGTIVEQQFRRSMIERVPVDFEQLHQPAEGFRFTPTL